MINIFNIKDRKIYTNNKIKKITSLLTSIFKTGNIAGWFIAFFLHYTPHVITLLLFLYYPFNLSFLIIWLISFCLHLFFKGCIHLRLERSLFNNKKWSGPYHILENFDTELNTKNMMKVYYILSLSLLLMYVIKFINYWIEPTNSITDLFFIKNKIFYTLIVGWVLQVIGFVLI